MQGKSKDLRQYRNSKVNNPSLSCLSEEFNLDKKIILKTFPPFEIASGVIKFSATQSLRPGFFK